MAYIMPSITVIFSLIRDTWIQLKSSTLEARVWFSKSVQLKQNENEMGTKML